MREPARAWSPEEDKLLRDLLKEEPAPTYKELAAKINRPLGSIASRIESLGLSKRKRAQVRDCRGVTFSPRPGVIVHRKIDWGD